MHHAHGWLLQLHKTEAVPNDYLLDDRRWVAPRLGACCGAEPTREKVQLVTLVALAIRSAYDELSRTRLSRITATNCTCSVWCFSDGPIPAAHKIVTVYARQNNSDTVFVSHLQSYDSWTTVGLRLHDPLVQQKIVQLVDKSEYVLRNDGDMKHW